MVKGAGTTQQRRERAVLIYDGNCPICSSTIAWIRENEQENAFEMLPCRSEERTKKYSFVREEACIQAMQLVLPDGKVLVGEQALPEILKRLRRYRAAANLFKLPGSNALARAFYQWFAGRRYDIAKILFPRGRNGKKAA